MDIEIIRGKDSAADLAVALNDLDLANIFTAADPELSPSDALAFIQRWYSEDASEINERLSLLSNLKGLTDPSELKKAIGTLTAIGRERDMLKLAGSRFTNVLFRWRLTAAYVTCVTTFCELLDRPIKDLFGCPQTASSRLQTLQQYFSRLRQDKVFSDCQEVLTQLSQLLPLPHYLTLGLNVREDGHPTDMGIISVSGSYDPLHPEAIEEKPLNPLLGGTDPDQPSLSLAPEFVYNRQLYGSHFDEYIDLSLEHQYRSKIQKADKLLEKVDISASDQLLALVEPLDFYRTGLLVSEAFEQKGYKLCRPQPRDHTSLTITNALYPDFILHHTGIQGNDLTLAKGSAVIITGPNHSGKTSYLKTIGQCYVLAQLGFFIPADSMVFEPVKRIFTLFSAGEDSSMTKSRMGIEVKKLTQILKQATSSDLIFLNEPMTSTNPVEAVSICAQLTRHFIDKGITHLLVTHLYDIYYLLKAKLTPDQLTHLESLITLSAYDEASGTMRHSYKLTRHEPLGNSYARETAAAFGIPLDKMIADPVLKNQASDYIEAHNIDSIYEREKDNGLSDNH